MTIMDRSCRFCAGRGFYGIPGQRCGICDGSGTMVQKPIPQSELDSEIDPYGMWAAVQEMMANELERQKAAELTDKPSRPDAEPSSPVTPL